MKPLLTGGPDLVGSKAWGFQSTCDINCPKLGQVERIHDMVSVTPVIPGRSQEVEWLGIRCMLLGQPQNRWARCLYF